MKKIIVVAIILALAIPFLIMPAFKAASKAEKSAVDVGNKICPVSNEAVSGKHFVVYKGLRYGLCCPMCERSFLKDPEKYLTAMKAGKPAGGMMMDMHETTLVSTATVTPDEAKSKEMQKDMEQRDF